MSNTIKQAIEALKSRIADTYTAISNKGGTLPATQDSANLPAAIASIPLGPSLSDFITYADEPATVADIAYNRGNIKIINDTSTEEITGEYAMAESNVQSATFTKLKKISSSAVYFLYQSRRLTYISCPNLEHADGVRFLQECTAIQYVELPKLITVGISFLNRCTALKEVVLPMLTNWKNDIFFNCTNLRKAYIPSVQNMTPTGISNCVNLIDITCGSGFAGNVTMGWWNPTNALNASSSSLVEQGEPFANNLEKLLYNIREHIAANIPVANYTITFNANVKAAILADQATQDAFTNKGWTIA